MDDGRMFRRINEKTIILSRAIKEIVENHDSQSHEGLVHIMNNKELSRNKFGVVSGAAS